MNIRESNVDMNGQADVPSSQSDTYAYMEDVIEVLWKNYGDKYIKLLIYKVYKLVEDDVQGLLETKRQEKSSKMEYENDS